MRRLGALEALGRGISNVRGNPELVAVGVGGSLAVLALVVLALIPWLGADAGDLASLLRVVSGQGGIGDLPALASQSWSIVADLWGFVLALSVALTIGSVVYCWYFGGTLGVLHAGDAQAPPGGGRSGELYRTWSTRLFAAEAGRLVWRVLWFYSLWLLAVLGVLTLFAGGFALAAFVGATAGGVAGLAVGCGAALPLLFALFAVLGAMSLGQVELVPANATVRSASRDGWRVLGRRLGAVITLFVLLFATAIALGLVEGGVGLAIAAGLAGRPALATAAQVALFGVQLLLSTLLNLVFAAAFVALARSERRPAADAAA